MEGLEEKVEEKHTQKGIPEECIRFSPLPLETHKIAITMGTTSFTLIVHSILDLVPIGLSSRENYRLFKDTILRARILRVFDTIELHIDQTNGTHLRIPEIPWLKFGRSYSIQRMESLFIYNAEHFNNDFFPFLIGELDPLKDDIEYESLLPARAERTSHFCRKCPMVLELPKEVTSTLYRSRWYKAIPGFPIWKGEGKAPKFFGEIDRVHDFFREVYWEEAGKCIDALGEVKEVKKYSNGSGGVFTVVANAFNNCINGHPEGYSKWCPVHILLPERIPLPGLKKRERNATFQLPRRVCNLYFTSVDIAITLDDRRLSSEGLVEIFLSPKRLEEIRRAISGKREVFFTLEYHDQNSADRLQEAILSPGAQKSVIAIRKEEEKLFREIFEGRKFPSVEFLHIVHQAREGFWISNSGLVALKEAFPGVTCLSIDYLPYGAELDVLEDQSFVEDIKSVFGSAWHPYETDEWDESYDFTTPSESDDEESFSSGFSEE